MMLYLNNPFLNTQSIINFFEQDVVLGRGRGNQSALQLFRYKLKAIYFDKKSEAFILENLNQDARFDVYPKLKAVIKIIFECGEHNLLNTLGLLEQLREIDWPGDDFHYAQFQKLNDQWQYFIKITPTIFQLYQQLVDSCHKIGVFFENLSPEDDFAYIHAYKLMVIFPNRDFDTIAKMAYKLIKPNQNKTAPYHELLSNKLEIPHADSFHDKLTWTQLIQNFGQVIFPYFAMAGKIELQNQGKVPNNLKTLERLYALCCYEKAHLDPELALICHRHQVEESMFNDCLEYIDNLWPKKTKDNIPNVCIELSTDTKKYVWLKLPTQDKRALIIGHITDCCQSIGHHGETSVKDAVSFENCGIYVLLESKSKQIKPYIIAHQINDYDYKIIGQSEIWRDKTGNLCLDSLEILDDGITSANLKKILEQFSTSVVEQNPDIRLIHIGQGGRTPVDLYQEAVIEFEKKQGSQYIDSLEQYILYSSLNYDQTQILYQKAEDYPYEFIRCIYFIAQYHGFDNTLLQLEIQLQINPNYYQTLSWNKLQNIVQVLGIIPELKELKPVNLLNIPDNSPLIQLMMSIHQVQEFIMVFKIIPDEMKYKLLHCKDDYNILFWISACRDLHQFRTILQLIPINKRLECLKIKNVFNTVLQLAFVNGELLNIVLTHLSETDIKELMFIKVYDKTILEHAASKFQNLSLMMNVFDFTTRRKLILTAHSEDGDILLFKACSDLKSLQYLMNHFNENEQRELLELKNSNEKNLLFISLEHAKIAQYIISLYPLEQRLEQCLSIIGHKKLMTYIGLEPEFLEAILSVLGDHDKISLVSHIAWYDKSQGIQKYVAQLYVILENYPKAYVDNLLVDMLKKVPTLMHDLCFDKKTFELYWENLSFTLQHQVLQTKDANQRNLLFQAMMNPEVLEFIFDCYPKDTILEKDHLGQNLLNYAISQPKSVKFLLSRFEKVPINIEIILKALNFPESLQYILQSFEPPERFELINQHQLVHHATFTVQTENICIMILLENLNFEQFIHLYKTQPGFQYLNLEDWKNLLNNFGHQQLLDFSFQSNKSGENFFSNMLIDDEIKEWLIKMLYHNMSAQEKFDYCKHVLENRGKICAEIMKLVLQEKLMSSTPSFRWAANLIQHTKKISTLKNMFQELAEFPRIPSYLSKICFFSNRKASPGQMPTTKSLNGF